MSGEVDVDVVAIVLQILLGVAFLGAGGSKLAGVPMQVEVFDRLRLPQGFRLVVGVIEIVGALGVLVGIAVHSVAVVAALGLDAVMLGALLLHLRAHDAAQKLVPPAVLLGVTAVVVALRWSTLRGHVL